MSRKMRVGIFSFTGDEGCVMEFLETLNEHYSKWFEKAEFVNARLLKSHDKEVRGLDVAFVEGAISTGKELARLKEVRANCVELVAIGSCAITGYPSNHRNFFDAAKLKEIRGVLKKFGYRDKVQPLHDFVEVDAVVPGCPMLPEKFVEAFEGYLKEFGAV